MNVIAQRGWSSTVSPVWASRVTNHLGRRCLSKRASSSLLAPTCASLILLRAELDFQSVVQGDSRMDHGRDFSMAVGRHASIKVDGLTNIVFQAPATWRGVDLEVDAVPLALRAPPVRSSLEIRAVITRL